MSKSEKYSDYALLWLKTILEERFGHAWQLSRQRGFFRLNPVGADGYIIFSADCEGFGKAVSDLPCANWDAKEEGWDSILGGKVAAPGVSSLPVPLVDQSGEDYVIQYDIIGLIYWMLARIEEIGRTDLDEHQRFPATSSHAFKHGYLNRPIVDEWLHILKQVILRRWPSMKLKSNTFRMYVSHDVDRPMRYGFANCKNLFRRMAGDVIRGHLKNAILAPWVRINTNRSLHVLDPFNTFDWIMEQSENHGMNSAFYFQCGGSSSRDAEYEIDHPAMRELLRRIHARGHEIGLHPSFNTFLDSVSLNNEATNLRRVCHEEQIQQSIWGGRMHYLRWREPTTLLAWNDAGLNYDSTRCYADYPGFRCGTCFEYPGYDPVHNRVLSTRIRPLIAMEASVLSQKYMGLNAEEALVVFLDLKRKCRLLDGQFTLLWHNSEFVDRVTKDLYLKVIQE